MDIDFNRPKRLKPTTVQKAPLQLQRSLTTRQKVFKVVDMQSILKSLHRANPSAAIFTVLPSVSTEARISACSAMETRLPQPLSYLYNGQNRLLPKEQLSDFVQHTTLTVNEEEACYLERSTRGQASTPLWFEHRLGRITASVFGRVAKCREKTFPSSLVKTIMQYSGSNRDVPAIKWGIEHEQEAREAYANIMAVKHATFKVNPAGLRVCTRQPFLAATPDGVVSCSCCGEGLLEIKCPFKYRNSQPASIEDESFYLHKVGSEATLDKKHDYYYQVQGQRPSGRNHTVTLSVGQQKG